MSKNDTRITSVALKGFKGFDRTYDLEGPIVLTGPNEAGKSACMEALAFVLSGRAPDGSRALESIAEYFPADGGTVTITDALGRWCRRGYRVKKGANQGIVEKSDDADDWSASEHVLDIRSFALAMSPEAARQEAIRIASGAKKPEDVIVAIEKAFVRQVGGPGTGLGVFDRLEDLPELETELLRHWTGGRGIREEIVEAYRPLQGADASRLFARLQALAKDAMLAERRQKLSSEAAVEELRDAAAEARVEAEELPRLTNILEEREAALQEANDLVVKLEGLQEAFDRASGDVEKAARKRDSFVESMEKIEKAGPKPTPWKPRRQDTLTKARLTQAIEGFEIMLRSARSLMPIKEVLDVAISKVEEAERLLASHEADPIASLSSTLNDLISILHGYKEVFYVDNKGGKQNIGPLIASLCDVASSVCMSWQRREDELARALTTYKQAQQKASEDLVKKARELDVSLPLDETIKSLEGSLEEKRSELQAIESSGGERAKIVSEALDKWIRKDRAFREKTSKLKKLEDDLNVQQVALKLAREALEAAVTVEIDPRAEAVNEAKDMRDRALEAAQTVKTFEETKTRARESMFAEEAWKRAERAIREVRETHAASAIEPLLDDVNDFLRVAGRHETAFADLETPNGKPLFRLGWKKSSGERVPLRALSAAASQIYLSGLSLAVAKRSPGRRVLMIEADPLRDENRETMLRSLLFHGGRDLDALIVATSRPVDPESAPGWKVIDLEKIGAKA